MAAAKRVALLVMIALTGAGCSSVSVEDYRANRPEFVPETFFDGRLTAHGVIKNRAGKVIRRFTADITAYWQDGTGILEEDFLFDDGERDRRVWTLVPAGEGRYRATAGDVIGEGDMQVAGNSVFLDYVLRIPYGDGTLDIRIDDRMYLISEQLLINESVMLKFGLEVGRILLVIEKHPGQ